MPISANRVDGPEGHAPTEATAGARDATWDVLSEHIKDLIILTDLDGTVFYVSPSCRNFGYSQFDLVGRRATDFLHPDDLAPGRQDASLLPTEVERSRESRRERRFRCKDGSWVWLEGNPSTLEGAPGVAVGRLNVFRNVTERRADREALAEHARRAAMAEEVAGVGYWRLDAQTLEATWSPQIFRMHGLAIGDTVALVHAMDMVHPEDKAASDARVARSLETGEGWTDTITRIVQPDGALRYLSGRGICETDAQGEVVAVFGTVLDVTDQMIAKQALEESEHRYRLLAEHATDMISLTSGATGQITYLSPSVERVTGYSVAELIGTRIAALVHPDDKERFVQTFADLRAGLTEEGRPIRFRAKAKDGGWIWLESNPRIVRGANGEVTDIIDVTREVGDEEVLKAQLRTALAEAQHAAAVKAEFLANMSHEIRTPLTAVLGFAGLLGERTDLDATAKGQVGRIAGASRALLAVVNDVLDFSKLEAGEVTIRRAPASAEQAAREVLEMFALQAGAKGVDLRFEAAAGLPQSLLIDEDRLRQILINLVGNAVKFTERGRVSLALSYGADGRLAVEVSDTGPGIASEAKAKLFQRFSQIDGSSTRSKGGSGLGLAICQGLAQAMDGEVSVTSRVGRGSTFRLVLPAMRTFAKDAEGGFGVDLETLCGVRVLVADDNAVNRELARAILEPAGVEVSEAVDGLETVEAAGRAPFDAILMDLRMPGLDGHQALAAIRNRPGPNQHMPILAFSADGMLDIVQAAGSGFQGVVRKPTSPGELLRALARAIDTDQALEEGAQYAAAS
jgi:PAS domain S-box-containing protein